MDIKSALAKIGERRDLTGQEMRGVMEIIMTGEATPSQVGAFLMGMRVKGETVSEIAAAVSVLREQMVAVVAPDDAIDIVGTGGDGGGAFNISTPSAFVVAAAGVPVAKHGNRALSSKSGSSQVIEALGVKLDLSPAQISRCIEQTGIGFMFGPAHHQAMRHVGPIRSEMAVRTMFNLVGPQANPAGVRRYLFGVYGQEWVEPIAASLLANRVVKAWVACGSDGLDKLTTAGPTFVAEIANGNLRSFTVTPEEAGLPRSKPGALVGGEPQQNAASIRALLGGAPGPYRNVVLLNSAAAFIVADKVHTLREGAELAATMIDSGTAMRTLDNLVSVSNEPR